MPTWVYKRTEETKNRISVAKKLQKPITEETRERLRTSHLWKKLSQKTRDKMSIAQKWRTITWWDKISKSKEWPLNAMWKWWVAWYSNIHEWISKVKWTPSVCEHCWRTDKKKYEWANVDHLYRKVEEDYVRLCTQCHRIYDHEYNNNK